MLRVLLASEEEPALGAGEEEEEAQLFYCTSLQLSSPETLEYYVEVFRGLRTEYWCSQIAIYGCEDPHVVFWLKAEYAAFPDRDAPNQVGARWLLPSLLLRLFLRPSFPSPQICDSDGIQHPTYCAFKSHQCLQKSLYNQLVRSSLQSPASLWDSLAR